MIQKQTLLDKIEIERNGVIQVRLAFLLLDDGAEISKQYHRVPIPPGASPENVLGIVNRHLSQMKKEPVSVDDIAGIAAHVKLVHTPKVVAAYKAATERETDVL